MHMSSQIKENDTRSWAFLPPRPPPLNIEDLRDYPGSIYLSDGRTRIHKCTNGIKISVTSYKMKTMAEHRTSRAKKQG